ncbi:MAG: stalk domain-containing protein [Caldisericia bacterium]|jgi:sugar lactone lactonase YvrE|nr:hypothetical protein [Caldisericia bacterium]MDD5689803.1 stalk domain-containing protein [Caldisericia bacterium]HOW03238.1 stalk domain-containing protein [Caldisericia bacterium]
MKKSIFTFLIILFVLTSFSKLNSATEDSYIHISINESQFLYVGNNYTKRIIVLEKYGYCIKDISTEFKIKYLEDICSCPCGGYLLISDPLNNKVVSIDDIDGKTNYLISVENPGSLAISKNKTRYEGIISEKRNSILLYTDNGKNIREIPQKGRFNEASAILIDKDNNIWVSDSKGGKLLKLDLKGNILKNIKNADLYGSIDIDSDKFGYIYTISKNKSLLKFGSDGKFLGKFNLNNILTSSPVSLAIDPVDSFIWIACSDNNIFKFDSSLKLIDKITDITEKNKKKVIYLKIGSRILDNVGFDPIILDAPPFIDKGSNRTLVPVRAISEIYGAEVQWFDKERKVTIKLGSKIINLFIGKKEATINGKTFILDCSPVIVSGRTFVPLRFISEALGAEVKWFSSEERIVIAL